MREARQLAAQGELKAAQSRFNALDLETHGHPSAIWSLAQIAARLGESDEAIRRLEEYASMGLARAPQRDSSFSGLARDPRFGAVVQRFERNAGPLPEADGTRAIERIEDLLDPGLLAEDVAVDPRDGTMYVSSIHRRKVVAIAPGDSVRDFVRSAQDGIWGVYGLALDVARGLLWGSIAAGPTHEGFDPADSGRTAVVAWALGSGAARTRVELPRDGRPHVLGDLALGEDGTLYATDSVGGGLYALRAGASSFDTLAVSGTFGSPQMAVVLGDGRRLLVADYPQGLVVFDPADRSVTPIRKPRTVALTGIDGLFRSPRRDRFDVVAVQNGMRPARILNLRLDASGTTLLAAEVYDRLDPSFGEPNHGTPSGGDLLFIGNSGWDRVNARDELETDANSSPPFLFRLRPRPR